MNYARSLVRRAALRKTRRSIQKSQIRRGLLAERLEERSLLAGDLLSSFTSSFRSDYCNITKPTDVNFDGRVAPNDAIAIINVLNSAGPHQLPQGAAEGETGRMFIDVNNDGYVSAADALAVINRINSGEGEPDTNDKVTYTVQALDLQGNPITSIGTGQDFILVVSGRDLRQPVEGTYQVFTGTPPNRVPAKDASNNDIFADYKRGVAAAYMDLLYNKTLTNVRITEVQNLNIQSTAGTGSFDLALPGKTPITINFNNASAGRTATAAAIKSAVDTLIGVTNAATVAFNTGTATNANYRVTYSGQVDVNEPLLQVSNFSAGTTVTPTTVIDADPANAAAFFQQFQFNATAGYINGLSAVNGTDRIGSLGSGPTVTAVTPITLPDDSRVIPSVEVVRVRMQAHLPNGQTSGQAVFTPNFDTLASPSFDTLVFGNATQVEEISLVQDSEIDAPAFTLTINSGPVNAVADTGSVNEDNTAGVTINVLQNDSLNPPATGTLEVKSFTQPASGGTVTAVGNQLKFVPAANFAGTATFTYNAGIVGNNTLTDQATASVTVTVNPINDAPTINNIGNQTINEDAATSVNMTGIGAGGGTDEAGQTITITATSSNQGLIPNPTVTYTSPNASGTLNFTPVLNQTGTATITVTVQDSGGTASGGVDTTTRTFTVTVNAVNDAPVNNLAGAPITGATPPQLTTPGVDLPFNTANGNAITVTDVDAGTSNLNVTLALGAGQGTLKVDSATGVTITGNNSASVTLSGPQAAINTALAGLVYSPAAGFVSTATLTITSNDNGATGSGGAQQTVSPVSILLDPGVRPFAVVDRLSITEGTTAVQTIDALANDFKAAGATTTITAVTQPPSGQGSVVINAGKLDYTPPGGDFFTPVNPVQFTYTIHDDVAGSIDSTGTVSITITNVPDAPVAVNDSYQTAIGVALTRNAAQGVLVNDTDVDNIFGKTDVATLTVLAGSVTQPAHGTVTVNADGSFTYTPAAGFGGDDSFTYKTHSSLGPDSANAATVSIHVAAPPQAVNDSFPNAQEDQPFTSATSVLANDSDPTENQTLTAVLDTNVPASAGSVTLQANGIFTYNPAQNFNTTRPPGSPITFTYHASAGGRDSAPATVSITVNEVNDNPTAANDTFTAVKNNGTVGIDQEVAGVLANDTSDPDVQETLTVTGVGTSLAGPFGAGPVATPAGGSVRFSGGKILYTSPTVIGPDSFTYQISDGRGGTASATVNVNVVDFVPKNVSGTVFIDTDNDGQIDAGESKLAGVEIHLTGTDFLNATVALTTFTDANGNYSFTGLKPPAPNTRYTITEIQPAYLLSGIDTNGSPGASAALVTNASALDNLFTVGWIITDASGNISNLNFGERGVNFAALSDSSGFLAEFLASSGSNGFVIAADLSGNSLWSWSLPGWENAKTLQVSLSADLKSLTLSGLDYQNNAFSVTLHQTYPTAADGFPAGSTARFRILGIGQNGQYIIRVDATAADCGLNLLAAAAPAAGGEGEASVSPQYAASADAVFAEGAWA